MPAVPLPESNHVIRYCRKRDIDEETMRPTALAFQPSAKHPDELSVNWSEFLSGFTDGCSMEDVITELRKEERAMQARKGDGYVFLEVRHIHSTLAPFLVFPPMVLHSPVRGIPSHAEVKPFPVFNEDLQTELASLAAKGNVIFVTD